VKAFFLPTAGVVGVKAHRGQDPGTQAGAEIEGGLGAGGVNSGDHHPLHLRCPFEQFLRGAPVELEMAMGIDPPHECGSYVDREGGG
jgi:hypothetical protein